VKTLDQKELGSLKTF